MRDRLIALLLGLPGLRRGLLGLLPSVAGRGPGRQLPPAIAASARDRVLRRPLGLLSPNFGVTRSGLRLLLALRHLPHALLSVLSRAQGGLSRLVGLHPLPPPSRPAACSWAA